MGAQSQTIIRSMTIIRIALLLSVIALAHAGSPSVSSSSKCAHLEVQTDFNTSEYLRASWYVQKQQKNGYQPASSLFCVVATYNETFHGAAPKVPFFSGEVFSVFNDCHDGGKHGAVCNNFSSPDFKPSFGVPLCGRVPDASEPAKITVAPCKLPNVLSGNYWVAAAGPTPDNYEYALIVAGQPSVQKSDGCTTPDTCNNPAEFKCGLWMFTREPKASAVVMDMLMAAAKEKQISTQLLIDVDQSGCNYDGMEIK